MVDLWNPLKNRLKNLKSAVWSQLLGICTTKVIIVNRLTLFKIQTVNLKLTKHIIIIISWLKKSIKKNLFLPSLLMGLLIFKSIKARLSPKKRSLKKENRVPSQCRLTSGARLSSMIKTKFSMVLLRISALLKTVKSTKFSA